jgi:hypothetical protein
MRAGDVRRWIEDRRVAESRALATTGQAPDALTSFRQALSLLALLGRMVGWPVPPDAIREREDVAAGDAWAALRAGYRHRP